MNLSSGTDSDSSDHELGYYVKDKVKLMKEVLKLIKPKKIKSMAPDCMKNLNITEINSMLLEELLGISNKRLNYIFKGENVNRESSSSDSDAEKDVISLDDISDDDIALSIPPSENNLLDSSHKHQKKNFTNIKTEKREKPYAKDKLTRKKKHATNKKTNPNVKPIKTDDEDKIMSVLELLELQARARAIRSQLALEHENKTGASSTTITVKDENDSDDDAVIIESPQHKEIIITSDSDDSSKPTKNNSQTDIINLNISTEVIELQTKEIDNVSNKKSLSKQIEEKEDLDLVVINDSSDTTENEIKKSDSIEGNCSDNTISAVDKRKLEKTFSRKQKIKLVRNKVVKVNAKDKIKSLDDVKLKACTDAENMVTNCEEVVVKVESDTKRKIVESNDDGDGIVINLDEDEMNGIEDG